MGWHHPIEARSAMIKTPTVLILGAGASIPYGFPDGRSLKLDIAINVNTKNKDFVRSITAAGYDAGELQAFGKALEGSPLMSVDAFLERRSEFVTVGKVAIARQLIGYEQQGLLQPHAPEHTPITPLRYRAPQGETCT